MIWNGYSSDQHEESRYHCALAAALGAASLLVVAVFLKQSSAVVLLCLTLAIVGTMSAIPVFWQMPNRFLTGAAAAGGVALINSIANLAGFGAPWMLGLIKDGTGSLAPGLYVVAVVELGATFLILTMVPAFHKRPIGGAALAH
jgi:predicted MFS family arabinose efflux permease